MQRCAENPILSRDDVPAAGARWRDVSSVFNPGAVRIGNRFLLLLRVQNRGRETCLMTAESEDGIRFRVRPRITPLRGIERSRLKVHHVYDPRITRIGSACYVVFAMDVDGGCRLGLAATEDFDELEFISLPHGDHSRNGVLFPQTVGGRYLLLDRPNRRPGGEGAASGDTVRLSESADLREWKPAAEVFRGRPRYWDERIGPGPPPVKTRDGWLLVYHGIATHFAAANVYQAGVVLLALDDPARVLARGRCNILEPREYCEQVGQVPNVVFPSGLVPLELDEEGFAPLDGTLHMYYGAADTCVCLAATTVRELLRRCREE